MIYSASEVLAREENASPFYFVLRQLLWCLIGMLAMVALMNVHYRKWNNRALIYGSLIVSALVLGLVLFGPRVANVHRWFRFGPLSIQPAELAKLPLLLFLAHHLARKQGQIESFPGTILPALFVSGQLAALVVIEPDLGTAIMFVSVTIVLLFFAGMPLKYFAGFAALSVPAFYFLVMNVAY